MSILNTYDPSIKSVDGHSEAKSSYFLFIFSLSPVNHICMCVCVCIYIYIYIYMLIFSFLHAFFL